ncbi:hypothetical protein E1264_01425 [Actinomadura sp. KC216]|uniref:hypothetical protein n=1 Tax=Actinomadura sp. KC216 TaxID=2530370 RepID=UPI0010502592|nr:hypothetical protein [Actinomadura sp. KC216]TDB91481.1 hypothetical protein E1264_01425 [Actinomadura sp. KC216]
MNTTKTSFLTQVGPDLYRENPFRVTGLTVDATARDIRRRSEELQVKAKLGAPPGTGSALLPLDPPPDADAAQRAIQRLRDPVRRLEDELFWFWSSRDGDEALAALRDGRVEDAERLWSDPGPGRPAAVAAHNLAVLAHARALDDEAPDPGLWERALRHWRAALDTGAFWDLVAARARTADDPRIGPGAAAELRERLPAALLSISARLAVRESEAGEHAKASAHIDLMRGSGFDGALVETALRDAVAPVASRLRSQSRSALERADATPESGHGEAVRLLERAEPVLAGLGAVLPGDHSLLEGLRDEVADSAMRCVILYGNETGDWHPAEGVLERAEATAVSANVRTRIAENLETVRENQVYAICWFCKENPSHDGAGFQVKMHGEVNEEITAYYARRITWRKLTITVPRCAGCASAHRTRRAKLWAYGLGSNVALFALGLVLTSTDAFGAGVVLMILTFAGFAFAAGFAATTPLSKDASDVLHAFPAIQEKFQAGWSFGHKPPGVQ